MSISLPFFADAFELQLSDTQWVITAYMLAMASTVMVFAHLGDQIGHWRILKLGTITFAFGALLSVVAGHFFILVLGRFILALGAGMIVAASVPLMTEAFGSEHKTKAFALLTSGSSLGAILGPYTAGYLLATVGWRGAFFVPGTIVALIALFYRLPPLQKAPSVPRLDLLSAGSFSLTVTALLLGINQSVWWFLPAVGLLTILIFRAFNKHYLNRASFGLATRWAPLLGVFLIFAAVFFHVLIPSYLQIEKRIRPETTGQFMMIYFASVFAGTRLSAFLDRHVACRVGAAMGAVMSTLALGLMGLALQQSSLIPTLVLLGAAGLGLGIFIPFNGSLVLQQFGKQSVGFGGGLIATCRSLGIAVGVAIALELQHLTGSFSKPFFVGAFLSLSAALSLLVHRRENSQPT